MRTITNPKRGCGTLKKGGFYARSSTSTRGRLKAWSWLLGEHTAKGINLSIEAPPRQMEIINLPMTIHRRSIYQEPTPLDTTFFYPSLTRLPQVALLDHVGSQFYNPMQFALEVTVFGVSRRVPPSLAKTLVKYLPVPIVFTHSHLPIVDDIEDPEKYMKIMLDGTVGDVIYHSTYADDRWGLYKDNTSGANHWVVSLLNAWHQREYEHWKDDMIFVEQAFGISWLTQCAYIAQDDDTDEYLQDIADNGIMPYRLEGDE